MHELSCNVKHKAIPAACHQDPFTEPQFHILLDQAFNKLVELNDIPVGYGVQRNEWEDDEYPLFEVIKLGRKQQETQVALPEDIWYPRAIKWVRGLHGLNKMLNLLEE